MRNESLLKNGSEARKNRKSEIRKPVLNAKGVSLIAAVFIIIILAFMGVMFLSLISTSTLTAVNDLQSGEALYIAEGGREYIQQNRVFPNYSTQGAPIGLGAGNFMIATPAYLTADPGAGGATINVDSAVSFPASGRIIIDSELIDYTGTSATSFTGATRGADGTTAAAHAGGSAVYPIATLAADITAADTTITVISTTGFAIPGVFKIESEAIYCTAKTINTFTGCSRGYKGSIASAHTSSGGIAFDAASSRTGNNVTNLTWSHTVGTGSNRILVVGVSIRGTNAVSRVRYAGTDLTFVGAQNDAPANRVRVEFWRIVAPATGANNIRVDFGGNTRFVAGAVSLSGADQTAPIDAGPIYTSNTIPTAPSRSITTVTNNAWVIDTLSVRGNPAPTATVGAGQIQRWNNFINTRMTGAGSTEGPKSPAGAVTMSWSLAGTNGDNWILGAVAVRPAPAAAINVCQYIIVSTGTVGNANRVVSEGVYTTDSNCGAGGGGGGGGSSPAGQAQYPDASNPDGSNPALNAQAGNSGTAVDGETYSPGDLQNNGRNMYVSFYNSTAITYTYTQFALTGPAGSPNITRISYSDFTWNGSAWVNGVADDNVWNGTRALPVPQIALNAGSIIVPPSHRIALELRFNADFLPGTYTLTFYDAGGTPYAFTFTL